MIYSVFNHYKNVIKFNFFVEQQITNGNSVGVQSDENLEFLKEQMKNHQDFVERERETLIWMLGVIVSIVGGTLAFIGIKSKKDLENLIEKIYSEQIGELVEDKLQRAVGDNAELEFLKRSVKRERAAKSKKILFAYADDDGKAKLEGLLKLLPYDIRSSNDPVKLKNDPSEIKNAFSQKDIVVYCVPSSEWALPANDKVSEEKRYENSSYKKCIDTLENNFLILWTEKFIYKKATEGENHITVNYKVKCLETLSTLLYLEIPS